MLVENSMSDGSTHCNVSSHTPRTSTMPLWPVMLRPLLLRLRFSPHEVAASFINQCELFPHSLKEKKQWLWFSLVLGKYHTVCLVVPLSVLYFHIIITSDLWFFFNISQKAPCTVSLLHVYVVSVENMGHGRQGDLLLGCYWKLSDLLWCGFKSLEDLWQYLPKPRLLSLPPVPCWTSDFFHHIVLISQTFS